MEEQTLCSPPFPVVDSPETENAAIALIFAGNANRLLGGVRL